MKKIYLIDGNSFIYRMFFALPEFFTKDGRIVNAVFGMAKFFVGQLINEKPDYIVFIKDARGENFRHKIYNDYKATRERMPDNLRSQIADIEKMIGLMNVEIIEIPGYEADDVIGTLAKQFDGDENYEVDILTGDKDLYQLTSDNIKIYDTMKKKKFGPDETKEKFGVENKHVVDYLAIVGDKSDNIPGIDGFGPKKAVDLINVIGGVEEIYDLIEGVILPVSEGKTAETKTTKQIENAIKEALEKQYGEGDTKKIFSCFKWKTFEKLLVSREDAFLSKRLATLDISISLENFDMETFAFVPEEIQSTEVQEFFREHEFFSLLWEEDKTEDLKTWKDTGLQVQIVGDKEGLENLMRVMNNPLESSFTSKGGSNTPPAHSSLPPQLRGIEGELTWGRKVVIDTETTSLDVFEAQLVGVSVYIDDDHIYYINRLHNGAQVQDNDLQDFLNKLFEMNLTIIGHNLKYDLEILYLFLQKKNWEHAKHSSQMSLWV